MWTESAIYSQGSPMLIDEPPIDRQPIDLLLVEDNQADLKITLRAFEKGRLKNNIYTVKNGQEALDFIFHEGIYQDAEKYPQPDIVLLDIMMPKMDGFEALKRLKENERHSHIPVVMLTTSRNEEDVIKSFQYGAVSYIPKPITYEEFIRVVDGFNFYWQIINKLPRKK